MTVLGDAVLAAARGATRRALLCAPFVKTGVFEPLLEALAPDVEIELYTRWRPDEVAAGVSDTGVLALLEARGGRTFLCDPLHAKLFAFDDVALVGSANLTAKALGWGPNPNLELMLEVPADTAAVGELERELRRAAVPATAAIAEEVERVAALLQPAPVPPLPPPAPEAEPAIWHPHLREPRDLFVAYRGDSERLSRQSQAAAAEDLSRLELPPGLDRPAFEAVVGTRLMQEPVVQQVDELLTESRRFGEVRDLLSGSLGLQREEASYVWQTLMRWMLHFLPARYARSVPSHSEILVRREGSR